MHRIKYTEEMRVFILNNYKGISTKELAGRFNEKFGTNVTVGMMKSYKGNHKLNSGLDGYFAKGSAPHNKGLKMSTEVYEKAKATMFKKGHTPYNHKPIGSERVNVDGYVEIKVAEPNTWRLKHNVIYEKAYGKIPKSHVVIFLDGNKLNLDSTNLKLISRKELLIMNRYGLFQNNAELTEVATNIAKIIDKQNERKKEDNVSC